MKKSIALIIFLLVSGYCEDVEKKGFLTSKWCAQNGYFSDCRMESLVCGSGDCYKSWDIGDKMIDNIVLFVHAENKIYDIDYKAIPRYELDQPMNQNEVSIIGKVEGNTIIATGFKAPPPPQKSFFKGCL